MSDHHDSVQAIEQRLTEDGAPELLRRSFAAAVRAFQGGQTGFLSATEIAPVEQVPRAEELQGYENDGRAALAHTVILKLNGGLGTSMGLAGPKSLLVVKDGRTFFDLVIAQVTSLRESVGRSIPLLFMNSFSTDAATQATLAQRPEVAGSESDLPTSFLQHRVPKLDPESLAPAEWSADPSKTWCPPGHGDLYTCLQTTGILRMLLDRNYEYLFVSNIDNLGATVDLGILGYVAKHSVPFLMEVARRTSADKKGGHLAASRSGGLLLREVAQCPAGELTDFQDVDKYRYFNTNSLWINLRELARQLEEAGGFFALTPIVNTKPIDPTRPGTPPVIQLETAMGSAISALKGAEALEVPRRRFAPVKTTNELLVVRSDAYELTAQSDLRLADGRTTPPIVSLDPDYYKLLPDFEARFPIEVPSLAACERLTVTGDVQFGPKVRIVGTVTVTNPTMNQQKLANRTLEEETITP